MSWYLEYYPSLPLYFNVEAPCVLTHIAHGQVMGGKVGQVKDDGQSVSVLCQSPYQPGHNTSECHNGTWSPEPSCVPASCKELPDAPRNGMVVATNLSHGMVGKFEVATTILWSWIVYILFQCRDGFILTGNDTTQCHFGAWTGITPWCEEGELIIQSYAPLE